MVSFWPIVMMMLLTMVMVIMYIVPCALGNHSSFSLLFIFYLSQSIFLLLLISSFSLRCHPEFFLWWRCHLISRMMVWFMAMKLCVDNGSTISFLPSGQWYDVDDDDGGAIVIFSLSLSLSFLWWWLRRDDVSIGVFVDVFVYVYTICLIARSLFWC